MASFASHLIQHLTFSDVRASITDLHCGSHLVGTAFASTGGGARELSQNLFIGVECYSASHETEDCAIFTNPMGNTLGNPRPGQKKRGRAPWQAIAAPPWPPLKLQQLFI